MLTPYFLSSSVRLPRVVSSIEGLIFDRLGELSSNIFLCLKSKINIGLYLSYTASIKMDVNTLKNSKSNCNTQ